MLGWNSKEYIIKHLSRVDIELIETVKVFFILWMLTIEWVILFTIEYVPLGLNDQTTYYPLEKQTIYENGYYKIENEMLFQPQNTIKRCTTFIMQSSSLIRKLERN
jgi:hypothetical protein